MGARVTAYNGKGAALTAVLCLGLMGGGLAVMYMSAGERLECTRIAGGRASCGLDRVVLGFSWHRDLGVVQAVDTRSSQDPDRSGRPSRQRVHRSTSWVVYQTDAGQYDGVQSESYSDVSTLVRDVRSFLATPSSTTFEARVAGSDSAHRVASWMFWAGLSLAALWSLGWVFPTLRHQRSLERGRGAAISGRRSDSSSR